MWSQGHCPGSDFGLRNPSLESQYKAEIYHRQKMHKAHTELSKTLVNSSNFLKAPFIYKFGWRHK